ncbi:MAG: tetratricopeptide repeat protein [Candidatus Omnitrophica bacterium]|nr:tetratricopeptide repeat protein [Candidatus Omnitrophota bacterium]
MSSAETISLKSGKTIEADIVETTSDYIKVDIQGAKVKYYLDEIQNINKNEISNLNPDFQKALGKAKKSVVKVLAFDDDCSNKISLCPKLNLGSGFIISSNGLIATNCHVLAGFAQAQVWLDNKLRLPVKEITAYDIKKDICIIKVEAPGLEPLKLSPPRKYNIGDSVLAIGYPLNPKSSLLSDSRFEADRQLINFYQGNIIEFIDLSYTKRFIINAPIEHGISGSPFITQQGQVIAIAIQTRDNMAIAASIDDLLSLANAGKPLSLQEFSLLKDAKAMVLNLKAKNQQKKGKLEQAISYYRQSVNLSNENIDYYFDLGLAYEEKGSLKQAADQFEKIIKKEPGYALVEAKLAHVLSKEGSLEAALKHSQKAIKLMPNDPEVSNNHGLILSQLNKNKEAIAFFKKVLAIDPRNLDAYINLGNSYCNLGDYKEGMKYYEKAIDINPDSELPYHNVAKAYFRQGLYVDAITYYRRAIEKNPSDAQSFLEMAIAHHLINDFNLAQAYFQKAKMLFERQGQKEKARKISQYLKKPSIMDFLK